MRKRSPTPFEALNALAADAGAPERAKRARELVYSADMEKAALSPATRHRDRLADIAQCANAMAASDLPERVRADLATEFDRMAFRVLWAEGLMPESLAKPPPLSVATRLLDLIADGLLPHGAVGRAVLERAQALIALPESVDILMKQAALREHLLARLASAELRLRSNAVVENTLTKS